MATDDQLPLVDETGAITGSTTRAQAHGDPSLLHPVVHCHVFNTKGELLLQLRSRDKDIQPGKWDTSVGGHVDMGETPEEAVAREIQEEIGLTASRLALKPLYAYIMRNAIESEYVHTFACRSEGPFRPQASEIDELRFWTRDDIRAQLGSGAFTPNFEEEFARMQNHWQP